jgi:hypothetical protein
MRLGCEAPHARPWWALLFCVSNRVGAEGPLQDELLDALHGRVGAGGYAACAQRLSALGAFPEGGAAEPAVEQEPAEAAAAAVASGSRLRSALLQGAALFALRAAGGDAGAEGADDGGLDIPRLLEEQVQRCVAEVGP